MATRKTKTAETKKPTRARKAKTQPEPEQKAEASKTEDWKAPKLTQGDLIAMAAERAGMPKAQMEKAVKHMGDLVHDKLIEGHACDLRIMGGTFERTRRAARTGRDPRTGKPIEIPEKWGMNLKTTERWKKDLNQQAVA